MIPKKYVAMDGYIQKRVTRSHTKLNSKSKSSITAHKKNFRKIFFIRYCGTDGSYPCISIGNKNIYFPKEDEGKRVVLKVEVLE